MADVELTRAEKAILCAVYDLSGGSTTVGVKIDEANKYVRIHRLLEITDEEFMAHHKAVVERVRSSRS